MTCGFLQRAVHAAPSRTDSATCCSSCCARTPARTEISCPGSSSRLPGSPIRHRYSIRSAPTRISPSTWRSAHALVTFDVVDGITCAQTYPEVRHQLAGADSVVLTKADLAEHDAIERARSFVRDVNPLAQRTWRAPDFDVAKVFEYTQGVMGIGPQDTPRHAVGIRSFCLRIEGEVDWASFSIWLTCLLNRHGSRILRFKGISRKCVIRSTTGRPRGAAPCLSTAAFAGYKRQARTFGPGLHR